MDERQSLGKVLGLLEQDMKQLEIRYEQYFSGIEKREPLKDREDLARKLRQFANRRIIQTNLRFKYQNLATRFHSYVNYWDRILRLMDEGKFHRGQGRPLPPGPVPQASSGKDSRTESGFDSVYQDLVRAHQDCKLDSPPPDREQVAAFLSRQQEKIREKFGDRDIEFRVTTENGKPKIKVRAKN